MAQASRAPTAEELVAPIDLGELQAAVRAADPAAILVPPRILRRVIKHNARLPTFGWRVPHRKSYVLTRAELFSIVAAGELDLGAGAILPDTVILLARPSTERLAAYSAADNLTTCWRLLFHARVHVAFDTQIADGRLTYDAIRERIAQLGSIEFAEIRSVLKQEAFLLPPHSDVATYVEFAALFLELRYFADGLLPAYFPSIEDLGRIDRLLALDIDADGLLDATRPAGAPAMPERRDPAADEPTRPLEAPRGLARLPAPRVYRRLLARAAKVAARGNLVRAAILRVAAAERGTPEESRAARSEARADMERLADRLQAALRFEPAEHEEWARALAVLATQAGRGLWTVEGRLLYDLQKVCVDFERGIYTLDVDRWVKSGFRAPLKRPLPGQRQVLLSKHLRSAARRLAAVRVSGRVRTRLAALLQSAVTRAEEQLRSRFRPTITAALEHVHLTPQNLPERVAREKLVDELLDRIVERGFLLMGDLRDALSRNNLKLPDVASARQLLFGDQVLQANTQLADTMDGVYHRGEIYLTLPQRLSSLAFGTPVGRFLTQYVALPFGGAFLIQKGVQHLIAPHTEQDGFEAASLVALIYTGFFLLGLLHNQRFRMMCLDVLWSTGRLARAIFVDGPATILRLPVVQAIVHSLLFRLLERGLFKPLVVTVLLLTLVSLATGHTFTFANDLGVFLAINLLLNSRIGRSVDELVTDWLARSWYRFRIRVLATLFRFVMEFFNGMLENIERMLYTVDEWLRFRTGERPTAVVAKAVLGGVWFFVNYFIRFCVNLLIEPQINPIKHFPVVTVSHKILLPLTVPFIHVLEGPLGKIWADTVAPTIVLLLPGVFGFLVWELKENWRLYAANRPPKLAPVTIGHHGESLIQYVKPGFRSGTLAKHFAKLRRAMRKAYESGRWKGAEKQQAALHHAEVELRRFLDRDLLLLLAHSVGWETRPIETGRILLGTGRILAELRCPGEQDSLWLSFQDEAGWLVAAVHRAGWLGELDARQRVTFENALAGFYKFGGVDLVTDQLHNQLDTARLAYDIDEQGLKVWPARAPQEVVRYSTREWPPDRSQSLIASYELAGIPGPQQLIFARRAISWLRWVEIWDADGRQQIGTAYGFDHASLLPSMAADR